MTETTNVQTPLPGLPLTRHHVSDPGIGAVCMTGLIAAAAIEPAPMRRPGGWAWRNARHTLLNPTS